MWIDRHESELGRWRTVRREAAPALRPFVRDFLGAESTLAIALEERHLPQLGVALVVNLGAPHRLVDGDGEQAGAGAWVVGLQTGARLGEAVGARTFMAVQLTPVGAHLVLRLPMDALSGRVVALDDIDPRFARDLAARAASGAGWPDRFDAVEAALAARLADAEAPRLAMRAMAGVVGGAGVGALAAELGCSHRRLIDEFKDRIGLAPKTVARIARFSRALAGIHQAAGVERQAGKPHLDLAGSRRRAGIDWADLAVLHGYYDQAHFIREFKDFAGVAPGAFVAGLRADAAV
jgi:AraC-like DNA-binding protein